jgi:hypothetical protein
MERASSIFARRGLAIGLAASLAMGSLVVSAGARPAIGPTDPVQLAQYAPYPRTAGSYPYPGRPPCNVAGSAFAGAARGAAGGAIIGGIAGNAGRGAAIGAAIGGISNASRSAAARDYGYCY